MSDTKWTPGPWVADLRGGCLAVYPISREHESPGLSMYHERNIHYSSQGAEYNGMHWSMSEEAQSNARLIAASPTLAEYAIAKAESGCPEAITMLSSLHILDEEHVKCLKQKHQAKG